MVRNVMGPVNKRKRLNGSFQSFCLFQVVEVSERLIVNERKEQQGEKKKREREKRNERVKKGGRKEGGAVMGLGKEETPPPAHLSTLPQSWPLRVAFSPSSLLPPHREPHVFPFPSFSFPDHICM